MRNNLEGSELRKVLMAGGNRWKSMTQAISATFTITTAMPHVIVLDPGGSGRTVLLPAEADGLFFFIANAEDVSGDLTVKEDAGVTTIATVAPGDVQIFVCNGTSWFATSLDTASITTLTVQTFSATASVSLADGTAATDKVGWYGTTPIVQRASASQTAVAAPSLGTAAGTAAAEQATTTPGIWGFATSTQVTRLLANVAGMRTWISAEAVMTARIRNDLKAYGIIKGAA